MNRPAGVSVLALALLLVALATLVSGTQTGLEPEAQNIWCLTCSETATADAILNVVLFLPLGAGLFMVGRKPMRAVLAGALVSFAIEMSQYFGWPPFRI